MKLFSRNKNHSDISIIWENPSPNAFSTRRWRSNIDAQYIKDAIAQLQTKPNEWARLFKVRTSNPYLVLNELAQHYPEVEWVADFNRELDGEPAYSIYGRYALQTATADPAN